MKKINLVAAIITFSILSGFGQLLAQAEADSFAAVIPVGFSDEDRNGINDRFQDANGDGLDDDTGRAYKHRFAFLDENEDGVNDLWVDRDGDGVNDLSSKLSKEEQRDTNRYILDFDQDGVNDITGLKYKKENLTAGNLGFIDESTGKIQGKFVDENGNGVDDRVEMTQWRNRQHNRDIFVDEDGDGICDGRGDTLRRQSRSARRHRRGRHR